jgi:hypothetical protein|tara:strand:- start:403 stop:771 length:369 start_codon:yes stop_codon:yes gene_type:complete
MSKNNKLELLTCHCKEVQIELNLDKGFEDLVRCNCSLCKRRGYIMAKIKLKNLKVIKGQDKLSVYKFGKKYLTEHFFCKICGIYTHHRSYTNPENYEYNIACIDKVDTFKYKDIPVFDGEKL